MQENDKPVLVYTTAPDSTLAETIAGHLVDQGLAACVNIIPGMVSIYVWQGERRRDGEVVLIVKTRSSLAQSVMAAVRALHSYDNPALMVLPVEGGSQDFLDWIGEQTRGGA